MNSHSPRYLPLVRELPALAGHNEVLDVPPMGSNADLIARFYSSFQQRDAAGMAACYHPEIRFSDPVFPDLRGPQVAAMWAMLCARATDLRIKFREIEADGERGRAHWEAWYPFARTGRRVHNRIDAQFEFREGLIVRHEDHFSFWRWAAQALGPVGWLLGWSAPLRNQVRSQAAHQLELFLGKPTTGT